MRRLNRILASAGLGLFVVTAFWIAVWSLVVWLLEYWRPHAW